MCEVGTRPALPPGDRGGGETPPASALSPPGCAAGEKCREMGEQPIFTTRAHVFQIDPATKKNWVPASKQAVTVSYFYDSTRNSYRIISVDGAKNKGDLKELETAQAVTFLSLWESLKDRAESNRRAKSLGSSRLTPKHHREEKLPCSAHI
ncbi:hypothetical protein EYD10_11997 [Varanus komodoensis]|nr:hypothetical protein EYD10_11997 [Varanus komodoensis]